MNTQNQGTGHVIGRVAALHRYPVKSMMGERLTQARIGFAGLAGDRVWAFVDQAPAKASFPWYTIREQRSLVLYQARFRQGGPKMDELYPDASVFEADVIDPQGRSYAVQDAALLADLAKISGKRLTLRFSEKGMQDARPLSIFGMQTCAALAEEAGLPLDPLRFRANLYIQWQDPTPFFEDRLVNKRLRIGTTLELTIVKKDPRCVIITIDPTTAEASPQLLRTVAKRHGGCAGVYAAVLREGVIAEYDEVFLLENGF